MTDTFCVVSPLLPAQEAVLRVESLASDGRGVARHNGLVIFMERALPGQRVRARVLTVRKRLAEAVVEEVLEPSPTSATA